MTEFLDALVLQPMLFKGTFFLMAILSVAFAWYGVRNLYATAMDEGVEEEF